jgi:hypothetical protein
MSPRRRAAVLLLVIDTILKGMGGRDMVEGEDPDGLDLRKRWGVYGRRNWRILCKRTT